MHLLDTDTLTHLHAGHPRVIDRFLIASIALANNAIPVTRNVRHFRQVHGVSLVNWVD